MNTRDDIATAFNGFKAVAVRFCDLVDSSANRERADLLLRIYVVLPELIQQAIKLPCVEVGDDEMPGKIQQPRLTQQEWGQLYHALNEKLGDWNLYMDVFDPTRDTEAIHGSLADDIADVYRDIKEGLDHPDPALAMQHHVTWKWRFGYYSHWGQHVMGALRTIHWLLANEPEFVSFQ
jgi:hypothetical protein